MKTTYEKVAVNFTNYEQGIAEMYLGEFNTKHLCAFLTLTRGGQTMQIGISSKSFSPNNKGKIIGRNMETGDAVDVDELQTVPEGEKPWEIQAEIPENDSNLLKKFADLKKNGKIIGFQEYKAEKENIFKNAFDEFLAKTLNSDELSESEKKDALHLFASTVADSPLSSHMCCPKQVFDTENALWPCFATDCCEKTDCPFKMFLK